MDYLPAKKYFTEEFAHGKGENLPSPYAIQLECSCIPGKTPAKSVDKNGNPVYYCYYSKLKEIMGDVYDLPPSDRLAFIRYQTTLRRNPTKFLKEIAEFVKDVRQGLDESNSNTSDEFLQIISQLKAKITASFVDKRRAAIKLLQSARVEGRNLSLKELLLENDYHLVANDEYLIADELEKRELIKATKTKDGVFATLTANGIMFDPAAPSGNDPNTLSNTDLLAAITRHFDQLMAKQSVLIASGQFELNEVSEEINEVVEELNRKAGGQSKGPIRAIADSYLGKLVLSEAVKRGIIKPVLDDAESGLLKLVEAVTS